jgi:hypothetical protein
MMRSLLPLLLLVAGIACAQTPGEQKYCGTSWTGNIVPDKVAGCELAQACKAHDVCYGKCDPGGALAGTPYCGLKESSPERREAKRKCDDALFIDIRMNNPGKHLCSNIAAIYAVGVILGGQGPFNGRPMSPLAMRQIAESSLDPAEAAFKAAVLFNLAGQGKADLSALQASPQGVTVTTKNAALPGQAAGQVTLKKGMSIGQLQTLSNAAAR